MEKMLELLAQHGPFALLSGGLIYLFSLLWKRYHGMYGEQHTLFLENTKTLGRLTDALEDVVVSVQVQGDVAERSAAECKAATQKLLDKLTTHLEECRIEKAREEGRRSVTDPHGVPIPRGEES